MSRRAILVAVICLPFAACPGLFSLEIGPDPQTAPRLFMPLFLASMGDSTYGTDPLDPDLGVVPYVEKHGSEANRIWLAECNIAVEFGASSKQNIYVFGKAADNATIVILGDVFYWKDNVGASIEENFESLWPHQERSGQEYDKGGDLFYGREVQGTAIGITRPTENLSVLEPLMGGNYDWLGAHELGHQLSLLDRPQADPWATWIMYPDVSGYGTNLSGMEQGGDPTTNSECFNAREHGKNERYFRGPF